MPAACLRRSSVPTRAGVMRRHVTAFIETVSCAWWRVARQLLAARRALLRTLPRPVAPPSHSATHSASSFARYRSMFARRFVLPAHSPRQSARAKRKKDCVHSGVVWVMRGGCGGEDRRGGQEDRSSDARGAGPSLYTGLSDGKVREPCNDAIPHASLTLLQPS